MLYDFVTGTLVLHAHFSNFRLKSKLKQLVDQYTLSQQQHEQQVDSLPIAKLLLFLNTLGQMLNFVQLLFCSWNKKHSNYSLPIWNTNSRKKN